MGLKDTASLALIPAAYKTSKIYSALPTDGDGDFTFIRTGNATRVNKAGLVETMGTNIGRLNYDLTNGTPASCPSLLLEPSRTNLLTQSETYTTVSKANLTVADNTSIVDPQGGTNTKTLTATNTDQPRLEWRGTAVPASNTSYAMSFWVRYNTARYVAIAHYSQSGEYAIFDLVDGEVESDVGTQTAKIEEYPNDWYKISKSFEVPSTAIVNYWKFTLCTQTNAFVGVNGEKADVFGMQLEAGTYPTSYIPTSGSAVTRNVDTCKLENFANMPTDYPFTVFWEGKIDEYEGGGFTTQVIFSLVATGEYNCYFALNFSNTNTLTIRRRNSTDTSQSVAFSSNQNTIYKVAVCFISSTAVKVYINGSGVFNSTNLVSVPYVGTNTPDTVLIGQLRNTVDTGKRNSCDQFMLFNEALTDSELQTLTS